MKTFENNNRTFLAVEVPADAEKVTVREIFAYGYFIFYYIPDSKDLDSDSYLLPDGQWKLIGRFNELSEEQMQEIAEKSFTPGMWNGYTPFQGFWTQASSSVYDRLMYMQLNPNNTVLLEKIK